jgi:hypothetical protein
MNAKLVKKLRRIALGMVVAAEAQDKTKKIERVAYVTARNGQIEVARNSWKGAYKALKKGLRSVNLSAAYNPEFDTPAKRLAAVMAAQA